MFQVEVDLKNCPCVAFIDVIDITDVDILTDDFLSKHPCPSDCNYLFKFASGYCRYLSIKRFRNICSVESDYYLECDEGKEDWYDFTDGNYFMNDFKNKEC